MLSVSDIKKTQFCEMKPTFYCEMNPIIVKVEISVDKLHEMESIIVTTVASHHKPFIVQ